MVVALVGWWGGGGGGVVAFEALEVVESTLPKGIQHVGLPKLVNYDPALSGGRARCFLGVIYTTTEDKILLFF